MLRRLAWYARRIAVMERGEIRHRIHEQLERRKARRETGWETYKAAQPRPLPLFEPLFSDPLPERIAAQIAAAAAEFTSGKLRLLNLDWPETVLDHTGAIDKQAWVLDPAHGGQWPGAGTKTFDVDFRFEGQRGDVKFVWELNRLQFLAAPAIHARRTGDEKLAKAVLGSLVSWMEANPPGEGVNWNSGIEMALRLASLAAIVSALQPWIGVATGNRLGAMAAAHGTWIARFPSLFSSANNHLVAEAMGLVLAARMLPEHAKATEWLETGRRHLEDRTLALFHADGVGAEQSPAYSAFTLEMLITGFAALSRDILPKAIEERLAAATDALAHFLDDAGNAPRIGDDDEGRVFSALGDAEPRYIASVAATTAGFLGRPAIAPPLSDPHWRDVVFAAPSAGPVRPDGTKTFAEGGYTIRRGTIASRRAHLAFDHGPIGFGAIAAHGHADTLSVWLSLDGKPMLVDAGTYLYHGEGENRARFRVSRVHNTLTIGGQSQSEPSGAFNWMPKRAQARLVANNSGPALDVSAEHDGYAARFGAVHARTVRETATGFVIVDTLSAMPKETVEIAFLFAQDLTVEMEDQRAVARRDGEAVLTVKGPDGAAVSLVRDDRAGGRGLHSPRFGQLQVATTLVFSPPRDTQKWQTEILLVSLS